MNIEKIITLINNFAPLQSQESWDNSGFQIISKKNDINKILLCLSITDDIIKQALENNCDLIISHHPLFFIPFVFNKNISIYSAHTNLDKADGGTTDTLISNLNLQVSEKIGEFTRLVNLEEEITLNNFVKILKEKLNIKNIRVVNNLGVNKIKKIAFCAGSGIDLLEEAKEQSIEVFVTGDVKYHTALESNVIIVDIGHFESERPVLKTIKEILEPLGVGVLIANEKSPFINY